MNETPVTPAPNPLASAQAGVARGMGFALVVTIGVALLGYRRGDGMMLEARGYTLGIALLVLGLWVAATVGNVARRRYGSARAIDGGDGVDPKVDAANAILRNTAEQALLAALAYGTLTLLDDHSRTAIGLFAACFSAGRLLFWSGYRDGAAARALGFGLTFYPSIAALLMAVMALLR